MTKKDVFLYLRLLNYVRPHSRLAIISILGMLGSAALEPVLPALMQPLIDKTLIQRHSASLWQVPLWISLAFIMKGVFDYITNVAAQSLAHNAVADLRGQLFHHHLVLPLHGYSNSEMGRVVSRITYDTSMLGDAVSTAWITIVKDSLVVIGLVSFLTYTAWQLTIFILLVAPAMAYLIKKINKILRRSSENLQVLMGNLTSVVKESIAGLRDIKMFHAEHIQVEQFDSLNQKLKQEQISVARVQSINVPMVQIFAAISIALVILIASNLSQRSLLTPGEFVAYIAAMTMIFEPIRRITNVNATIQRGLAAAESIFSVIDQKPEFLVESVGKKALASGRSNSASKNGVKIRFDRVTFSYHKNSKPILRDLSFCANPGELVKLSGPSGVGKSSIFHLICCFNVPDQGSILIDECAIKELSIFDLRSKISLVSQNNFIFSRSIYDNLLLARPNATSKEINDALAAANCLEFIKRFDDGIHTKIAYGGDNLSGGQLQRLSIARAYLKGAPLLLLDEPTSALDVESVAAVEEGLAALIRGRTTLYITHNQNLSLKIDQTIDLQVV